MTSFMRGLFVFIHQPGGLIDCAATSYYLPAEKLDITVTTVHAH
jgi:hypothetical protein